SPIPKIMMATGIHASGEIMRRNCVGADMVRSKVRLLPMSTPNGTPRLKAMDRPTPMRRKVAKVCSHVRGSWTSFTKVGRVSQGEKDVTIAREFNHDDVINAQKPKMIAKPARGRNRRIRFMA